MTCFNLKQNLQRFNKTTTYNIFMRMSLYFLGLSPTNDINKLQIVQNKLLNNYFKTSKDKYTIFIL